MADKAVLAYLENSKEFNNVLRALKDNKGDQILYGLTGIQSTFFMAGIIEAQRGSALVVTYNPQQGKKITENLKNLLPDKRIEFFPSFEALPYEVITYSNQIAIERMESLQQLLKGEELILVISAGTLLERMPPPERLLANFWQTKLGEVIDLDLLIEKLAQQGYERVSQVEGKGQFSIRGGIIDIFPLANENPIRIELFDDEVDSIRSFDVVSQRSLDKLQEVAISPAREMLLTEEDWERGLNRLKLQVAQQEKRFIKKEATEALNRFKEKFKLALEKVEEKIYFKGLESYINLFYESKSSILDYFNNQPLILVDEPQRIRETEEVLAEEWQQEYVKLLEKGEILPEQEGTYKLEELLNNLDQAKVGFSLLPKQVPYFRAINITNISAKGIPVFMGRLNLFTDEIKAWQKAKYQIVILTESEVRSARIKNILEDYGIKLNNITIRSGYLPQGFELTQEKIVLIAEKDIFGQSKKKAKPKFKVTENKREPFTSVADLKTGDYVVHVNHGIGRYLGIEKLEVGGIQKEYLTIKYSGEDRLYVPTEQIGQIQRYLGAEGHKPKISKLGGTDWIKAKNKAKQSVEDLAEDLLKLYAARESLPGYVFSLDTVWQKEFEESFPYEETPDQLRAIEEIKRDMESTKPMERLLCGDVGYGKTEVALRAAFKAVMDGKQVAVLVPTTILAQQHYNTFIQRFAGFPVNIEMLSRFRTAKEQRETIKKLNQGLVDVVIGTHRLVQDDIKFKDLGLLIIDEEQRFGVTHKEKLKRFKQMVDVIILTATPIPRTLYLSLAGARDMSVLETPPEERFPVQTYVAEFNANMIRDAIEREIGRGGQVYFVHNKVQDIDKIAYSIQNLVPDARIVVAHGQMKEDELEQVMVEFMKGEHDVLVCTTIIETGLDIPNVNTLIVNQADHLGLSQLYQLRGRVGRSNRTAYAYFTYRKDKMLTEVAEKRLQAIKEFTELGSGFKIAMRDLEIRGAGNLLGAEQHGQIVSVGYELYCQLLEEAMSKVKGKVKKEELQVSVELNVNAYIDENYIKESGIKIEIYKKIIAVQEEQDLIDLEEELEDRFGDPPLELRQLLFIAKLKVLAKAIGVSSIQQKDEVVNIVFSDPNVLSGEKLLGLSKKFPRKISFGVTDGLEIRITVKGLDQERLLLQVQEVIVEIKRLQTS